MLIYTVKKKSTFYSGIRIFNILPPSLTVLKRDEIKVKAALRKHLNTHSINTVDEFLFAMIIYNTILKLFVV